MNATSSLRAPQQQSFDDVAPDAELRARESHGNRGKEFEGMVERTHHWYKVRGVADVEYIENAFVFCSEGEFRRLAPTMKARMGDGRTLKRVKTSGDCRGTLRQYGLAFDAKQFSSDRLALMKIPRHQIDSLYSFAKAGGKAGFMCYAKAVGKVYWVDAVTMSDLYYKALFNNGVKTLNLTWFAERATLIADVQPGDLVDYAPVLLPQLESKSQDGN